jgi:hypothetical protein
MANYSETFSALGGLKSSSSRSISFNRLNSPKVGLFVNFFKSNFKLLVTSIGLSSLRTKLSGKVLSTVLGLKSIKKSSIAVKFSLLLGLKNVSSITPDISGGIGGVGSGGATAGARLFYSIGGSPEIWVREDSKIKWKVIDLIDGRSRSIEVLISNPKHTKEVNYGLFTRVKIVDTISDQVIFLGRVVVSESGWNSDYGLVLTIKAQDYLYELTQRYCTTDFSAPIKRSEMVKQIVDTYATAGSISSIVTESGSTETIQRDFTKSSKKAIQAIEELAIEDTELSYWGTTEPIIISRINADHSRAYETEFDFSKTSYVIWYGIKVDSSTSTDLVPAIEGTTFDDLTSLLVVCGNYGVPVYASILVDDNLINSLSNGTRLATFTSNLSDFKLSYGIVGFDLYVDTNVTPGSGDLEDPISYMHGELGDSLMLTARAFEIPVIHSTEEALNCIIVRAYDMTEGDGYPYHSTYSDMMSALNVWGDADFSAAKIVVGIPTYGRDATSGTYSFYNIFTTYNPPTSLNMVSENVPGGLIWWSGYDLSRQKAFDTAKLGYAGVMLSNIDQDAPTASSLLLGVNNILMARQSSSLYGYVGCDYRVDDSDNPVFEYFRRGSKPTDDGLVISLTEPQGGAVKRMLSDYNFSFSPKDIITRVIVRGQDEDGNKIEATAISPELESTYGIVTEYVDTVYGVSSQEYLETRAQNLKNVFAYTVKKGKCSIVGYPTYKYDGVYSKVRAGDVVFIDNTLQSVSTNYLVLGITYEEPPGIAVLDLLDISNFGRDYTKQINKVALSISDIGDYSGGGGGGIAEIPDPLEVDNLVVRVLAQINEAIITRLTVTDTLIIPVI